jgi:hypothetical protein
MRSSEGLDLNTDLVLLTNLSAAMAEGSAGCDDQSRAIL